MRYELPPVEGIAEVWARGAYHCPYCHGWEVRDRPLAVYGAGASHVALILRSLSDDVVLLTDGAASLAAAERERLAAERVTVDPRPVAELIAEDGELAAIAFADGSRIERRGLLVPAPLHQRSDLAIQLGASVGAPTAVAHDPVETDPMHRTTAPGVFAAGDTSAQFPQVAGAIAAGSLAAVMVVQSLLAEDVGLPFPPTAPGDR
jgi:thioredoxin reductase